MDERVEVRAWRVAPDELPPSDEERAARLFDWWRTIDAWILLRRGRDGVTDEIARELVGEGRPPTSSNADTTPDRDWSAP